MAKLKHVYPKAKLNLTACYKAQMSKEGRDAEFSARYMKIKQQIDKASYEGVRIISCDASFFGRDSIQKVAYSLPNRPIVVNRELVDQVKPFNILAGLSREYGLEHFMLIEGYVNSKHVVELFEHFAVALCDGASYFKSKVVVECHKKLFEGRAPIINIPYWPKGAFIEQINRTAK